MAAQPIETGQAALARFSNEGVILPWSKPLYKQP
jgi:hypothetical protein